MVRLIIDPQLGSVVFHVKDTVGQAWEVVVDESWSKSGSGDTIFNTRFSPGDRTAIIRGIAFPMQIVKFKVLEWEYVIPPLPTEPQPPIFQPKPGEPLPLNPKTEVIGVIGTRCDLINNYSFSRSVYSYRDRYTGRESGMSADLPNTKNSASRDTGCFLPAPPTAKDWQDGIQKQVTAGFDALSKYVTDGLKSVNESWQKGIFDLEGRMKTWIQDMILEMLLIKLMEGRKNGNSR